MELILILAVQAVALFAMSGAQPNQPVSRRSGNGYPTEFWRHLKTW